MALNAYLHIKGQKSGDIKGSVIQKGQEGKIMVIAADRRQATVIFRYLRAFLSIPLLKGMIERETADTIQLSNSIDIEMPEAARRSAICGHCSSATGPKSTLRRFAKRE